MVAEALVEDLQKNPPTVLVNSGDFTQRAREAQYRSAAAYIRRLPSPQINVPGNHDIPLSDIFRRFFSPLERFRRWISDDPFPTYRDERLLVMGINTTRSLTWKSARITEEPIGALAGPMPEISRSV